MPSTLAAVIPPMTVVPIIWRATEPAPDAVHSGTQPRMNANEVIMMGRRRRRAPSSAASMSGLPCSYCSLALVGGRVQGVHVGHVVHAIHLLLDGRGDRVLECLGIGAGVIGLQPDFGGR